MRKLSLLVAVIFMAACGSLGLGNLGTILGSASPSNPSSIQGTVNSVDQNSQTINLNVSYVNSLRNTQNGQTIYYTGSTQVVYQGQNYRVSDLEQGDQVSISGHNDSGRYVADTINVTRNVRG